jgi:hypothetical protein
MLSYHQIFVGYLILNLSPFTTFFPDSLLSGAFFRSLFFRWLAQVLLAKGAGREARASRRSRHHRFCFHHFLINKSPFSKKIDFHQNPPENFQ